MSNTCRRSHLAYAVGLSVLAMLLTRGAPTASADSCTLVLNVANAAISGFTGPFVCVSVSLADSTHANITFTSDTVGEYTYLMGDGSSVAMNVNATSFTVSGISGSNSLSSFFTPGPYSNGGSGNADGFGIFNLTINGFDGFGHSATSISFALTNTSGSWASVGDIFTPNNKGFEAASHIFVESPNCTKTTSSHGITTTSLDACATGYAANGAPPEPVPEPASLALLGTGLIVIGGKLRRKPRKQ